MFESIIKNGLTVENALICLVVSLACGVVIATAYVIKSNYTKNYLITLVLLPPIVQAIIMMVNGNIGTGVAVLGAFSLIRFRSVPGNSKDICCIFFAMAVGIATGIGQVVFAGLFTVLVSTVFVALKFIPIGERKKAHMRRLKITVPEDLDFEQEFCEIFKKNTKSAVINKVKTKDMGNLFVIDYKLELVTGREKNLIDALRTKNGNLPIVCGHLIEDSDNEL